MSVRLPRQRGPRRRVMCVYGTRPEAVKMAPVVRALAGHHGLRAVVTVTGQHRELLDGVNEMFGVTPAHDLDVIRDRQSLSGLFARVLTGMERVLREDRPDLVLVQGDTTTATAAALAAFHERVPVAHLEAGLRTGEATSPFPEEANRRLTARLAALHLAPTPGARGNLLAEGVPEAAVVVTGNTVIDALLHVVSGAASPGDPRLRPLGRDGRSLLLVTLHRRESWGEPMAAVCRAVARVARALPHVDVVVPVHPNPVVHDVVHAALGGLPNVLLTGPLGYGDFARTLARARVVLTDSGGIQEEAPSLGVPVLVARDLTERPEGVAAGTAALVGTDEETVWRATVGLLTDDEAHARMARAINPYGDGRAAQRCVSAIAELLGVARALPVPEEAETAHALS